MLHHYSDITDRLGRPLWWDECGVPRYCAFGPDEGANIYADEIALVEIACQECEARFFVATSDKQRAARGDDGVARFLPMMSERLDDIRYGDPPNYECCGSGSTMNSIPVRVVEFWDRRAGRGDSRRPELERAIEPDWWKPLEPTEPPQPQSPEAIDGSRPASHPEALSPEAEPSGRQPSSPLPNHDPSTRND